MFMVLVCLLFLRTWCNNHGLRIPVAMWSWSLTSTCQGQVLHHPLLSFTNMQCLVPKRGKRIASWALFRGFRRLFHTLLGGRCPLRWEFINLLADCCPRLQGTGAATSPHAERHAAKDLPDLQASQHVTFRRCFPNG